MIPPRFHRLTIRDVRRETPDAVSIAFDIPPERAHDYKFAPGQYLTLRAAIHGQEVRRSYSISSGPDDGELRIGVKRVENGAFSTFANEALQPGHAIDVMTPAGRFGQIGPTAGGRTYAGFAAGSGITPILSIVRGILAAEPESRVFLFYGNRSMTDMLFRTALEELKDRHLGRLSVFHVLSQEEQDLPVLNGRLNGPKVRLLLTHVVPAPLVDDVFICGPLGMSEEVEQTCRALGIAADRIHVERFVSEFDGLPRARRATPSVDAGSRTASLIVDGKRREVAVQDGDTILDAALRAGLDLPYACKGGMCSTCRAKVVEGRVTMDLNYSLEPWELEAGFVLTCQSHPTTERVVIDYDQV